MVKWLFLVARFNANDDRANLNCNRNPSNRNSDLGIVHLQGIFKMKTYNNLYEKVYNMSNLFLAWRRARKGKTKKNYVIDFEKDTAKNLLQLHEELKNQNYKPKPLKTFILRDPKTRKISKSNFRDRVVHHAFIRVIEPIFDKNFIYDNCANRKCKGTLFALTRFEKFQKIVTNNLTSEAYCFKADIKHYFQEVDREILLSIVKRKIADEKVIWLIKQILYNQTEIERERERCGRFDNKNGMPLGNLTSQFFANVYLNELDQFVKHKLKAKYYIRYVDDFIILHKSKFQLENWKKQIENFLDVNLNLELHPDKSRIINLSKGVDFVGFRNFYHYKLLRKRNISKIKSKIKEFKCNKISSEKFEEILQGWLAYAKWSNSYNLIRRLKS